jgi:cell division protein FtsZ
VSGITEIIKNRGHINVDFNDIKTMMKNSGMALMGCGSGTGENRVEDAVRSALESPLLNDFDLKTAKNVLLNITVGRSEQGMKMKQLEEINKLVNEYTGCANNFKSGIVFNDDPEFGDKVQITVIATGFKMSMISEISENTGNYIMIDSSYTYRKNAAMSDKEGIELPEVRTVKIGYNKNDVRKKISFEDGRKPALLVGEGVNRSELEHTAAIRRKSGSAERRE